VNFFGTQYSNSAEMTLLEVHGKWERSQRKCSSMPSGLRSCVLYVPLQVSRTLQNQISTGCV